VWEQAPAATPQTSWLLATFHCINGVTVGGTKGWRLPSVAELASLVDSANSNPALPTGHPFSNVQSARYWSASTLADDPANAWLVLFFDGLVFNINKTDSVISHAWCVRGGMNADRY
jgi:hypothetical protein